MDLDRWTDNPHPLKRRVPTVIAVDLENGIRKMVDVIIGQDNLVFHSVDPILAFMGPEVVTKFRYPAKNVHGDDDGTA